MHFKQILLIVSLLSLPFSIFSQIEINGSQSWEGIANVNGRGIQSAYNIEINDKFGIKPQIAYKCLCSYYSFTGTEFKNKRSELHLTGFYKLIKRNKYQLQPNIGLNLSHSIWKAEMVEPLDQLPIRSFVTNMRNNDSFAVSSVTGLNYKELEYLTLGFSFQIKNQFKISDKLELNVTPFIEMDYDRIQRNGGSYIGITYNK